MKLIKMLLIIVVVLGLLGLFAYNKVQVEVDETDLPTNVYEEEADLLSIVNLRLIDLFVLSITNEYTTVEEIINLVILDTVRENINDEYDPLGTCDTEECNYILIDENYYISYVWAELSEDDQLIVHVSIGSDKFIHVNTIIDFYMDIDINYLGFEISLTLDTIYVNEMEITVETLDKLLSNFDTENIEDSISKGELDMEEYKYTLGFSILP